MAANKSSAEIAAAEKRLAELDQERRQLEQRLRELQQTEAAAAAKASLEIAGPKPSITSRLLNLGR